MMRRVIVIVMAVLSVLGAVATADRRSASADVTAPSPVRVLDTRTGTGAGVQQLVPGVVLRVAIDGIEPSGSTSVMLNLTGARAGDRGFVSAWSCDDPAPATSVLNVDVGRAVGTSPRQSRRCPPSGRTHPPDPSCRPSRSRCIRVAGPAQRDRGPPDR